MSASATLRGDLKSIAAIGAPLIVNNLASIGVTVADTVMAGRLGAEQLAAVAIGNGLWVALFLLGLGIVMALGPTVAQHYGAGDERAIGRDTRQGLWLALVVSLLLVVGLRSMAPVMAWSGIEPAVATLAQGYLDWLSFGVPGAYGYHVLKQMNEGIGRTVPVATAVSLALPLNVLLNYSFLFGRFGAPALGAPGCGLGSALSFWIMFAGLAVYTLRSARYRRFSLWSGPWRPQRAALARLVTLGLPIGASLCLQSGLFTVVALLMGKIGTAAVAAHQITLNFCGLVFMLPLAFAMALTVRVGQAVGARDMVAARRIGLTGIALCGACSSVSALVTASFAPALVALYTRDAAVAAVALALFQVACWLQLADGVQVAAAFALRGLKDTRMTLAINAVTYWGLGFVVALVYGRADTGGAPGIWVGLVTALVAAGLLLVRRFVRLSARFVAITAESPAALAN